uniref:Uncharacterized protein n=1 Tax=Romanomermis culicivorax TaxID=13658 RepID=A0A915IG95_ROMCU
LGIFGAPACRCTTLVLALCVGLGGLVICGAGACITGFTWADDTPRSLGICLIVMGVVMIFVGFGLYFWDQCNPKDFLRRSRQNIDDASRNTQITSSQISTIQSSIVSCNGPYNDAVHSPCSSSRTAEAPPSYDDAVTEGDKTVQYRQNKVLNNSTRPSYYSAVNDSSNFVSTTADVLVLGNVWYRLSEKKDGREKEMVGETGWSGKRDALVGDGRGIGIVGEKRCPTLVRKKEWSGKLDGRGKGIT